MEFTEKVEYFVFALEDGAENSVNDAIVGSHEVLSHFGVDFFRYERVPVGRIDELATILRDGFEDGKVSDEVLVEAISFADFAILKFLLNAILRDPGSYGDSRFVRCLAFAGNICESIWSNFTFTHSHLWLLLQIVQDSLKKIETLVAYRAPVVHRKSYHGYDKRDMKDFGSEGYEEEERELEKLRREKADREDRVMTKLLLLTQIFLHPIDLLAVEIENGRDNLLADDSDSSSQPNIFQVLTKEIAESIFELNETLFEDAYQQSLKLLVALSSQYPPMSESYRTALLAKKKTSNGDQATHAQQASSNCAAKTEISERFVAIDRARGDGGALQQALLYVLNENNYPNLSYAETKATLRFCVSILYTDLDTDIDADENNASEQQAFNPGHFFVNDVKVLVEICLRELTNILRNSGDARLDDLRLNYLQVLHGILERTNWPLVADAFSKESVRLMLQSVIDEEYLVENTCAFAAHTLEEFASILEGH